MHRISCCWGSNGRKFGFRITGSRNRKGCKPHMLNSSFMDKLPSSIIFNIFSRVPVKCLARSRCVSKVWCNYIDEPYLVIMHDKRVEEEPTPIMYHQLFSRDRTTHRLCFHVTEYKQTGTTDYVLEPKEGTFFEYLHKKPLFESLLARIEVRGSCNGLLCLSQDKDGLVNTLAVVHPLRKECYELPPLPMRFCSSMLGESCGLGFDASTNTLKMVCVLCKSNKVYNNPDVVKKYLCAMVHVFGTNSWREIPQVPPYPITGKAIFANGCLHWLVSHVDVGTQDGGRPVIWFDVEKEEFGLIDPPKRVCDLVRKYSYVVEGLEFVDLNGEVGYVCGRTLEVWVLRQKEWILHCQIVEKDIDYNCSIEVMGFWNKDGDILIKSWLWEDGIYGFEERRGYGIYGFEQRRGYVFFVYNLKTGVLQKTNIAGRDDGLSPNFIMYPNTLSSIRGINTNSTFSTEKRSILKKSCQSVLSNFH